MSHAPKPIRRHQLLQPISREHHQGLLLCWKIRKGLSRDVEPDRIKNYITWFYEKYLKPHFEVEETCLFPILGNNHPMCHQAIEQHRELEQLINDNGTDNLAAIADHLDEHIRFEERVLFNEIQKQASFEQLTEFARVHEEKQFVDNLDDVFWGH